MSSAALELKKQAVDEIKAKIQAAPSIVIVDYLGLTVKQDTELRAELRKSGVEYKVLKNRLVKRALNELGYTEFDTKLEGPSAVAFASQDVVAPAKILVDSVKKYNNKITIKCGMVDSTYIDEEGVQALASLPPKEQIIAKMLGCLQAPISNLAYALNATVSGIAIALKAVADKK